MHKYSYMPCKKYVMIFTWTLLSSLMLPSMVTHAFCVDNPSDFQDKDGDGCGWYATDPDVYMRCERFGDYGSESGSATANQACCVCGGGVDATYPPTNVPTEPPSMSNNPTFSPSISQHPTGSPSLKPTDKPTISSFPTSSPWPTKIASDSPSSSPSETVIIKVGEGTTPSPTMFTSSFSPSFSNPPSNSWYVGCKDIIGWEADESGRTCEQIQQEQYIDNVEVCSEAYNRGGYSENTACCYCGGGLNLNSAFVTEVTPDSVDTCIDKPDWKSDEIDCSNYVTDAKGGYRCETYGSLTDTSLMSLPSGFEACCTCGGGYQGDLIGKSFRIGFVSSSEEFYNVHQSNGELSGSIVDLVKYGGASFGVGLYLTEFSSNATTKYPRNTTTHLNERCLSDLMGGHVDICAGSIWDTDESLPSTDAIFEDEFYLVSPVKKQTFNEYIVSLGMPFSRNAWAWIVVALLYLSFALAIIGKWGGVKVTSKNACSRIIYVLFHSIRSCASANVPSSDEQKPSIAEQIIATGFIIFAFTITIAYTATSAAYLVVSNDVIVYPSLVDLLSHTEANVCTYYSSSQALLRKLPTLTIININGTKFDVLDNVKASGGLCDAAILPLNHFQRATSENEAYCSNLKLISDDTIMTLPVKLFVSSRLGEIGREIIDNFNILIASGVYDDMSNLERYSVYSNTRRLKSSKGSSTSSQLSTSRNDRICSDSVDEDHIQYTERQLFVPIVTTLVCTTIGLIAFFVSKFKAKLINRDKITPSLLYSIERKLLRDKISTMAPGDVLKQLKMLGADSLRIREAMNMLPEKDLLVDLLLDTQISLIHHDFDSLMELELYDLYEIASISGVQNLDLAIDDTKIPKEKLIEYVLAHDKAKEMALSKYSNANIDTGVDLSGIDVDVDMESSIDVIIHGDVNIDKCEVGSLNVNSDDNSSKFPPLGSKI